MSKQHQLLAVPMMAEVLGWRERVAEEPVAEPLAHILDVCSERLLALFERYIHDSVRPPTIPASEAAQPCALLEDLESG